MYFTFTPESKIVIYGAGGLGCKRAKELINAGYHVIGFIDKEADPSKDLFNLPVYLPQDVTLSISSREDIIIIICIHNALWHQDIALFLNGLGYENILFLPIGERYDSNKRMELDCGYKFFADQNYEKINILPTYSTLINTDLSIQDAIIEENSKFVTVWMELSSIFTNEKLKKRGNKLTNTYGDVSICSLTPYIELFKYCKYGEGDLSLYCEAFKKVQNTSDIYTIDEFVQDRLDLYDIFRTELNKGMDYFVNAAPLLKWNAQRKHFNVIEGHHRLVFLMVEGLRKVPVKISRKDFDTWANRQMFYECREFIQKQKLMKWEAPISHPGFYNFEYLEEKINPTILMVLQKKLGLLDFSALTFCDLSYSGGYYARAFKSMGCSTVYCFDNNSEHMEFACLLNKLAFMDDIIMKKKELNIEAFLSFQADIVFLSLKRIAKEVIYNNCKEISELASKYLIIELDSCFSDKDLTVLWSERQHSLLKKNYQQTVVWLLY